VSINERSYAIIWPFSYAKTVVFTMNQSKHIRLSIEEFLHLSKEFPVFDVRTPSEFTHAHIPGARNLPIFSDEERAEIGTLYKQVSREQAIEKGFTFFGPKLNEYLQIVQSQGIPQGSTVLIHCWRGGMRSEAMAWLFNFYGFEAFTLEGGYKAYRNHVLHLLKQSLPAWVIGGFTGSGKTEILHCLQAMKEPILDLEDIAHHRGSSFGSIGCPEQTSQESFENRLAMSYPDPSIPYLWIEDESRKIGRNILPLSLFETIRNRPVIFVDIPRISRLTWLVEQYQNQDMNLIAEAVQRIAKRLGGLESKKALAALEQGNLEECFEIALRYYDDTYLYGVSQRKPEQVHRIALPTVDHETNAQRIKEFVLTINNNGMHG